MLYSLGQFNNLSVTLEHTEDKNMMILSTPTMAIKDKLEQNLELENWSSNLTNNGLIISSYSQNS